MRVLPLAREAALAVLCAAKELRPRRDPSLRSGRPQRPSRISGPFARRPRARATTKSCIHTGYLFGKLQTATASHLEFCPRREEGALNKRREVKKGAALRAVPVWRPQRFAQRERLDRQIVRLAPAEKEGSANQDHTYQEQCGGGRLRHAAHRRAVRGRPIFGSRATAAGFADEAGTT